ncbi:MAG: nucleotidyltransferase family protein [Hyphomicrobiales bacterium]|nr:nucleotidyltransferase family protein [Hyphomicrobiales bacterium]
MKREAAIQAIRPHMSDLQTMGVVSLQIFGATARDEASDTSDIDVLATFGRPPSICLFMDVKFRLERALGRRVDLMTPDDLQPQIRSKVENEAVLVANT